MTCNHLNSNRTATVNTYILIKNQQTTQISTIIDVSIFLESNKYYPTSQIELLANIPSEYQQTTQIQWICWQTDNKPNLLTFFDDINTTEIQTFNLSTNMLGTQSLNL